jgi:uracil-DNA glycosylase family 4
VTGIPERPDIDTGAPHDPTYDPNCRRCSRLALFLDQVKFEHPTYFCRPVPPFGDPRARLLIVGLAPGMHGANATGRSFTGDWCGPMLYSALYRAGFASQPTSVALDDGLRLVDCRISNAVKCLPPANKPELAEIRRCNVYLQAEFMRAQPVELILALGLVAHRAALEARGLRVADWRFGHHAVHHLPDGLTLIDSYHVSRYNTQTGRLTDAMFDAVLQDIRQRLA